MAHITNIVSALCTELYYKYYKYSIIHHHFMNISTTHKVENEGRRGEEVFAGIELYHLYQYCSYTLTLLTTTATVKVYAVLKIFTRD